MKPLSLATLLTDFSLADRDHETSLPLASGPTGDPSPIPAVEAEPLPPEPHMVVDRFEEGRLAGRAEAEAGFEQEWSRREREAEVARRQLEATLGAAAADRLARMLEDKLARNAAELSATLARLLVPLLRKSVETAGIAAFTEKVSQLITGAAGVQIEIRGPAALISALQADTRFSGDGIRLVETDQAELSASVDCRLLETRLKPLLLELEELRA